MAAKKTPLRKTEGATVIDLTKGGPRMTTARSLKAKWRKEWDLFQKAKLQKAGTNKEYKRVIMEKEEKRDTLLLERIQRLL